MPVEVRSPQASQGVISTRACPRARPPDAEDPRADRIHTGA